MHKAIAMAFASISMVLCNRCSAPTLPDVAWSVIDFPWKSNKEFLHGYYIGGSHDAAGPT